MADVHLLSPAGFRANAVHCGLKSSRPDLALLVADAPAAAAAVFTTNQVFAAPITVGREHIAGGKLQAVVVNSGNANACTGDRGLKDARLMCTLAARLLGCEAKAILPSSTGIIGKPLPMAKVEEGLPRVAADLGSTAAHAELFSDAILTTDLVRKTAGVTFKVGQQRVTIAGTSKGSGMIGPNLSIKGPPQATMLAYLTTDAAIPPAVLRKLFAPATDRTFNRLTVDGHTSTNDTAVLMASGAGPKLTTPEALKKFAEAMEDVCRQLAYQIAADGEGATKVVVVRVAGCKKVDHADRIARAIANSPLVKCAMHGNDPNWGRIVSAAGLAGVPFNPDLAELRLNKAVVFRKGKPLAFDNATVSRSLDTKQVNVLLNCGAGAEEATVFTCDLSKMYVEINAEYHT